MDLLALSGKIQEWFGAQEIAFDPGEENDATSGAFMVTFGEDLSGFVSYEDNAEDLGFPTVSVGVLLVDVGDAEKDFLVHILSINASLFGASLVCAAHDDGSADLYMQMRLAAEDLDTDQIGEAFNSIMAQIQHFLGPMMVDPEAEAAE